MKIAIVAPSPVPFTIGGAEKLWCGLQNYINDHTTHQCELFKYPTKEGNFWDLIEAYYQFYKLDLSYFDMVISTKYPAWMVNHHNHTVYLQHHLRGLFDTYHLFNEPKLIPQNIQVGLVKNILELINTNNLSKKNIDKVFANLNQLKIEQQKYNSETFKFPGPFIRTIIHFFDAYALAPNHIKKYFAISENVKLRQDYFPRDAKVDVIYHPSKVENFVCKDYDYLFTASRLDAPKRIDLLIKAMKYVPHDIKFKIAGTGPEKEMLEKMAKSDKRIEFVGYTSEEDLVNLYSNALMVLYIPHDEDYGLITIEGMKSRKPILTSTDSGGSLEFVKNCETGFVVDPKPEKIADKINNIIENKDEAIIMGNLAYRKVKDINWSNVAYQLLNDKQLTINTKKKILVLSTYSIFPPRGGGQHRLYNLYKNLAKQFDITVLSLVELGKPYTDDYLENGLRTICIPQSEKHARLQWDVENKLGLGLFDVLSIENAVYSTEYVEKVKVFSQRSDIIICSHPYLFNLVKKDNERQTVVYDSIDIEFIQKGAYLKKSNAKNHLIDLIWDIEKRACKVSDIIFAISSEEKKALSKLYDIHIEKISVVPNGVDTNKISFFTNEDKQKQKQLLGLSNYTTVLFIGSWHPPNLEALEFIVNKLAPKRKDCIFLIVGSINDYYKSQSCKKYPKNVLSFGVVSELEKIEIYKTADVAINPMMSGSGTNLKMLDYMAAGISIISTPIGARGLLEINDSIITTELEGFNDALNDIISGKINIERMRKNARQIVDKFYDWSKISEHIGKMMDNV